MLAAHPFDVGRNGRAVSQVATLKETSLFADAEPGSDPLRAKAVRLLLASELVQPSPAMQTRPESPELPPAPLAGAQMMMMASQRQRSRAYGASHERRLSPMARDQIAGASTHRGCICRPWPFQSHVEAALARLRTDTVSISWTSEAKAKEARLLLKGRVELGGDDAAPATSCTIENVAMCGARAGLLKWIRRWSAASLVCARRR